MDKLKPLGLSEFEVESFAVPILRNVINAYQCGDYKKLSAILSEQMKQELTQKKFDEAVQGQLKTLGKVKEMIYLGCLKKTDSTQTVWKMVYENADQEFLWQVFFAACGTEVRIAALRFS